MTKSGPLQVLVACTKVPCIQTIRAFLARLGHQVIAETDNGDEAARLAIELRPDLAILGDVDPLHGWETACQIGEMHPCPAICILTGQVSPASFCLPNQTAGPSLIQVHQPDNAAELESIIRLILDCFDSASSARLEQIQSMIDTRQTLQQATRRLAQDRQMSTQRAREWILQEAQAKRASLAQVAQAIISGQPIPYCHSAPV